jgi:exosortase/archaeosortase family protein
LTPRADRRPIVFLLGAAAIALLTLPFVTTFDDLLTRLAMQLGLDRMVQSVVPVEARMVVGLLVLLRVPASSYGSQIVLHTTAYTQPLFISWNCIGWQSLLILGGSMAVGLRGDGWAGVRLPIIVIGLSGTLLLNLARIATVCLVAARAGYVPAILFHDYGGTLLVIVWLLLFWSCAQRWNQRSMEALG